ncbi:threonine ammonia-lyase [Intrasporangium calvum]|uniref:threonine ammonia-lyase n=1 Tax=Intrasporangium calvum (strain ATCC 23552 / DSM 43043 / JCM 3097 / NBRC 12989 / NCIMB 10167 / NRRL B-3866 / 7 KIP) TaxID=710696 RepID=E6SD62_INTC7|nr:threonine ammonia-lyase [Intrasporangium calvum]ADU49680.1 L-threonine ammonia-lyase [Intrasporangium calvum DSM 43043]
MAFVDQLPPVTIDDVRAARALLDGIVRPTPLEYSRGLSERVGATVQLKCENLQRAGSFKIRGAYTRMARLSEEEKRAGVVAASAGNHAQGVALAASMLGIRAKVYMPLGAAMPKLLATQGYGADVEQLGTTIDECLVAAQEFADETGAVLIHPFDHPDIVAGQGSCGLEILEQCPDVKTVVVSVGGGGLLAGISTVVRALRPDVRIVGVQAAGAAAYPASLAAGHPVALSTMVTMADGIAVGRPGDVPFAVIQQYVDSVETVSEDSLARALLFLLERAKLVVEPAGAAAAAWLLDRSAAGEVEGPVVAVLSGGNIDPLLLLRIIRHGMAAGGRYLELKFRVPDRPGSLAALLADCARLDANVVDVAHSRTVRALTVQEVEIGVTLETKGREHADAVTAALREKGYRLNVD